VTTVVLDTNVLLDDHHPDAAFTLHHLASELKFIVPYVLVQELDNLKARAGGPRQPARVAISRLYDILVSGNQKEKWIRGQKTDERLPLAGTLQTTSGDDRILECTNYFHTYSPPGQRVALLTFDKNLQLKATLLGMVTGNTIKMMEFFKELANLRKERDILRALLKDAKGVDDVPDNPDLRLEDYVPGKEEEVDEFKLMKQAADKAAKEAKESEEREQQVSKEAKLKEAQRADVLARVPEGTKTNLYDTSDDSENEVERSKKDKKEKKEKNKKKRKRDDTDSSEDEDEPAKKKAKSEDRSKLTTEVVVLDD
jgi:predicted ribonuclease YlaK